MKQKLNLPTSNLWFLVRKQHNLLFSSQTWFKTWLFPMNNSAWKWLLKHFWTFKRMILLPNWLFRPKLDPKHWKFACFPQLFLIFQRVSRATARLFTSGKFKVKLTQPFRSNFDAIFGRILTKIWWNFDWIFGRILTEVLFVFWLNFGRT